MFEESKLNLNKPEEAISIDPKNAVAKCQLPAGVSPIADYFSHTNELLTRFVRPELSNDAITLSLLLLGVVSAAEFYFRSILVQSLDICPFAAKHADRIQVPFGSIAYYGVKTRALGLSVFEHKSLAGASEIKSETTRLLGVSIQGSSSVSTALTGFDTLCELRHAAIHTRGYISSKAASELGISQEMLQRIEVSQVSAFELTKLSHNAVRSFNRFLVNSILERWIANKYLIGSWRKDKVAFSRLFNAFVFPEESRFSGDVKKTYENIQSDLISRSKK
ncbi:MAG: hypothetical protein ACN6O1_06020 [Comamonas sp.]|uniref:hypothetical protein n=1 Tax=Comamonas sp. TaxID=34028 RepID=UPI003D13D868